MRPSDLQRFLGTAVKHQLPVLLKGAPGIGKTDIVTAAAQENDQKIVVMHPVVADPTDVKGMPMVFEGKAKWLPFGDMLHLIDRDKGGYCDGPTVCFLDDLGQAPPVVQAAYMQLLLARKLNEMRVSDYVTFIAATNRKADKAAVSGVLEPVKSRFAAIIELEVDLDDWSVWAYDHDMPSELVGFIKFRPDLLHKFEPTSDISNTPSPRTVAHVGKLMNIGLPEEMEYEAFLGAAGEAFASELMAWLKIYRHLPDPKKVLQNPVGLEMPPASEPATLYALGSALAAHVKNETFGNLLKICEKFPSKEFTVMTVKSAVQANQALKRHQAFKDWCGTHTDVLV